ncbi:MAG: glutamine-synthetase adenylyltransferase, partial [Alphaproteobacteria bacterium]|nr:glutamine-synthetase adenylyltransferase [Alphaproteobacteria bacterium]
MAEWILQAPLIGLPVVTDPERAALAIAELDQRCGKLDDPELGRWARDLADDPVRRRLLESIFANSPFLTRCALGDVRFLRQVLQDGPDTAFAHVSGHLKDELTREMDRDRLMRELRLARRRVALLVALADITGHWPLERVTQALSDFADAALSAAISHLLLAAAEKGDLVLADPHFPEDDSGYVALAMGKHGARELNYSSDIDLIILYEPMKADYRGSRSVQETFIRMTRRLVQIMQDRTADGYVARVDLRLRPDPGSS